MDFKVIGHDGTRYLVMTGHLEDDIGRVYYADTDELSTPLILHRLMDQDWELSTTAPSDVIESIRSALAFEPA